MLLSKRFEPGKSFTCDQEVEKFKILDIKINKLWDVLRVFEVR